MKLKFDRPGTAVKNPLCGVIGRRKFLKASGGAAAMVAGSIAMPRIARARTTTIQFWGTQRGTAQRAAYKAIIEGFEKEHPEFKVNIELAGADPLWSKLTSALAGGNPPDLISNLPAPLAVQLNEHGLLEPFDDVIKAIGESDFVSNALNLFRDKGSYFASTVSNHTLSNFWYRTDLASEAGLEAPTYWDELITFARTLTKGNTYGTIIPHGKSDMGTVMLIQSVWQAGGYFINPDLTVAFNSPETVAALEFLKEASQYSPPGSANYSYPETINGFISGRTASTLYTGRVIVNLNKKNPALADKFSVVAYPHRRGGRPASEAAFPSLFIPKGAGTVEGAKLFAQWLYKKEDYVRFLHAAPGHSLPVLKSVINSKEFMSHPMIVKYRKEVDVMIENTERGRTLLKESDQHPFNKKAGQIFSSKVLAETLQDVIVGGVPPKQAAAKGADRIAAIMKA